jgi:hypothetical protein
MQAEAPQYCISACCCLPNVSSGFGSFWLLSVRADEGWITWATFSS